MHDPRRMQVPPLGYSLLSMARAIMIASADTALHSARELIKIESAPTPQRSGMAAARSLRGGAESAWIQMVITDRLRGVSWAEIGFAFNLTAADAERRYQPSYDAWRRMALTVWLLDRQHEELSYEVRGVRAVLAPATPQEALAMLAELTDAEGRSARNARAYARRRVQAWTRLSRDHPDDPGAFLALAEARAHLATLEGR